MRTKSMEAATAYGNHFQPREPPVTTFSPLRKCTVHFVGGHLGPPIRTLLRLGRCFTPFQNYNHSGLPHFMCHVGNVAFLFTPFQAYQHILLYPILSCSPLFLLPHLSPPLPITPPESKKMGSSLQRHNWFIS